MRVITLPSKSYSVRRGRTNQRVIRVQAMCVAVSEEGSCHAQEVGAALLTDKRAIRFQSKSVLSVTLFANDRCVS